MKKLKSILCVGLAVLMVASVFTGCKKEVEVGERKLTYWMGNTPSSYGMSNMGEVGALKTIQENIGIEVEYVHPSSAAWEESFNIMIASDDMTDLINWNWGTKYNGGYAGAYNDGIIIDLSDKLDKVPNYKKILDSDPTIDKTLRTVDGQLFYFSVIRNDPKINVYYGPMIRQDWLDKLGLEMPQTISDWYNVLKAFKERDPNGNGKKDEIPLAINKTAAFGHFAGAYGIVKGGFYVKNGKVHYGSVQPEFKEFITEMNKWYKEGLIDSEYPAVDRAVADAYMVNDISGATLGAVGSGMTTYINVAADKPYYNLVAAPWPSKDANSPKYIPMNIKKLAESDEGTVITTDCDNLDVALEYMNYLYSDEATVLQNWGVEGTTYVNENGKLKFTDAILNSPDGPAKALAPYALTITGAPVKVMDGAAYASVQFNKPAQANAAEVWATGDYSLMVDDWPLTADEKAEASSLLAQIQTYENEIFTKFVMGKEPISNFNKYVSRMEELGVKELVAIYQRAYDRFSK